MKTYIGLDIGGTKMFGGLITEKGDILKSLEVPSNAKKDSKTIMDGIYALIDELSDGIAFSGIGIGFAGHVDHVNNKIAFAGPNFSQKFTSIRLAPNLIRRYKVPAIIENDAKIYALGEAVYGRGKGYRRVVVVTLGTGIGGAIVQDKQLIHGKNNLAGEFGKMFVDGSGKQWEQIAAGGAFNKHGNVQKGAKLVGAGLHNLLNILDPDIIVVGGGLSREPGLITAAKKEAHKNLHYPSFKKTPIVKSTLTRKAPILGAMLVVRGE